MPDAYLKKKEPDCMHFPVYAWWKESPLLILAGAAIGVGAAYLPGLVLLAVAVLFPLVVWVTAKWERLSWAYAGALLTYVAAIPTRVDLLFQFRIGDFTVKTMHVVVTAFLLLYLAMQAITRGFAPVPRSLIRASYAFTLVALTSSMRHPEEGLVAVFVFLIPCLVFFFLGSLPVSEAEWYNLVRVILGFAFILSFWTVVFAFNPYELAGLLGWQSFKFGTVDTARAWTPIGGPIATGGFLGITLPLAFGAAVNARSWLERVAMVALCCLIGFAVLLTLSRGVVLATIVSAVPMIFGLRRYSRAVRFSMVGVIILAGVIGVLSSDVGLSRLTTTIDNSISDRMGVAQATIRLVYENPAFGTGMGAVFPRAWEDPMMKLFGVDVLVDPHNLYLLVLSETGVVGALAFLAQFLALARGLLSLPQNDPWRPALLGCLVFLAVHSLGSSDLITQFRSAVASWIVLATLVQWVRIKSRVEVPV